MTITHQVQHIFQTAKRLRQPRTYGEFSLHLGFAEGFMQSTALRGHTSVLPQRAPHAAANCFLRSSIEGCLARD